MGTTIVRLRQPGAAVSAGPGFFISGALVCVKRHERNGTFHTSARKELQ
jgi:hypothetical protein